MPTSAWIILAVIVLSVLQGRRFAALNKRLTMDIQSVLDALTTRASQETDLKTAVITALGTLHAAVTELRNELSSGGLSTAQQAQFQGFLDTFDANRQAITDAIVANTDAPAPTPAGDDTVSAPATPSTDTVTSGAGSDTTSSPDTSAAPATPDSPPDQPISDAATPPTDTAPAEG